MPRNKRIPVGLPPEVHKQVKYVAYENGRTVVAQIAYWLKRDIEEGGI